MTKSAACDNSIHFLCDSLAALAPNSDSSNVLDSALHFWFASALDVLISNQLTAPRNPHASMSSCSKMKMWLLNSSPAGEVEVEVEGVGEILVAVETAGG